MRTPEEIRHVASVELYLDRARAAGAGFELTATNAPAVASLVTKLDGLPLALEMAGARARSVAPETLVTRLGDQMMQFGSGYRDRPLRHQSLVANLSWSYDLCSQAEQALWCRLAVFAGGFDLDAAETVASGETIAAADLLDLVAALVDQSILTADATVPGRYRMLEPVRQFGLSRLAADAELDSWRERHLTWVLALAHDLALHWLGPDQRRWLGGAGWSTPASALRSSSPLPTPAMPGLRCGCVVTSRCTGCVRGSSPRADTGSTGPWPPGAEGATRRSRRPRWQPGSGAGQLDAPYSHALAERAAKILDDDCSPQTRDRHHTALGAIALYDGDPASALRHGQAARAGFVAAGRQESHDYLLAAWWDTFALIALGRAGEAQDLVSAAINCSDRYPGELYFRTSYYYALGMLALTAGDLDTALAHEREALRSAWELRFDTLAILSLDAIAGVTAIMGRAEHSAAIYGAASREFERIGFVTLFPDLGAAGQAADIQALGRSKFDRAHAAGAAAPLESVVSFALTGQDPSTATDRYAPLTRREAEIAALVAEGLGNRAIAERLVLSERTVQGHIQNSLTKLHANSRAAIATWYVRRTPADQA